MRRQTKTDIQAGGGRGAGPPAAPNGAHRQASKRTAPASRRRRRQAPNQIAAWRQAGMNGILRPARAAAPLKHGYTNRAGRSRRQLRGRRPAAPLKDHGFDRSGHHTEAFRGRRPAAPLSRLSPSGAPDRAPWRGQAQCPQIWRLVDRGLYEHLFGRN